MTLHRLPNGTWIDPLVTTTIDPNRDRDASGMCLPRNAVTIISNNVWHVLPFADRATAQAYADSLAEIVNAAKAEAPKVSALKPYDNLYHYQDLDGRPLGLRRGDTEIGP